LIIYEKRFFNLFQSFKSCNATAAEILENPEFLNELKRLSSSFGIGVIKLDLKEPDSSFVLFPSKVKETLDWETITKLNDLAAKLAQVFKVGEWNSLLK